MTPGTQVRISKRRVKVRRRTVLLSVIVAIILLGALLGGLGYHQVRSIAAQLGAAQAEVHSAEAAVVSNEPAAAQADLTRAEASLIHVNGDLYQSRVLSLGGILPVGAQNLAALRRSVSLALQLVDGARQVILAAQPLVGSSGRVAFSVKQGHLPLATVGAISSIMAETAAALPGPSQVPSGHLLLGPVAKAQGSTYAAAVRARQLLSGATNGLQALTGLAGGAGGQRILFAVANDAEMRGTGGMILSYAVVDARKGHLVFERSGPIDDLALAKPASVSAPADYSGIFSSLKPTQQWRNANLDSSFTAVAPVLAGMYKAATGKPVTSVVQIDSVALAEILAGTGPITVPGVGPVGATNAVSLTLNQEYLQFPNRGGRQAALNLVVDTLVHRLLGGQANMISAAQGLAQAVQGRHVLMWAADPSEEATFTRLGATGSLPGPDLDFAQLSVQNFGANKLDYYLDTSLALSGTRAPNQIGRVQATVTLHNTAPASGTNLEVFGPFNPHLVRGQYVGFVSLHVPVGWYLTGSSGPMLGQPAFVTAEDGATAVSFYVSVPAGATRTVTLKLETPPPAPDAPFYLVPVPRVIPTMVSVNLNDGSTAVKDSLALTKLTTISPTH